MPRAPPLAGSRVDFCFTLYFDDDAKAFELSGRPVTENFKTTDPRFKYVIYQLERCPTTLRLHWQGFIRFKQQISIKRVVPDFFQASILAKLPHVERRQKSVAAARQYCLKEETRVLGPWQHGVCDEQGKRTDLDTFGSTIKDMAEAGNSWVTTRRFVSEQWPGMYVKFGQHAKRMFDDFYKPAPDSQFDPRQWQQSVIDMVEQPADDRTIVWVYDPVGGKGKSRLGFHLIMSHGAMILNGRVLDMVYGFAKNPTKIVIFDITRTQTDCMKHLYSFAETLKNGYAFSSKYEGGMVTFDKPHVIFFSNSKPEDGCWSADRLKLIDLTNDDSDA